MVVHFQQQIVALGHLIFQPDAELIIAVQIKEGQRPFLSACCIKRK